MRDRRVAVIVLLLLTTIAWAQDTRTVVVSTPQARIFREPVAYLGTVTTVPQDTTLTVLGERGRWLQVRTPGGEEGWFLTPRAPLPEMPPGVDRRYLSADDVAEVGAGLVTKGLVQTTATRIGADVGEAERTAAALETPRFDLRRLEAFVAEGGLSRPE